MDPLPSMYAQSRKIQHDDTVFVLEKYSKTFRWRTDRKDTLLDVGCGTGDVTIDLIRPLMPQEFGALVGVDVSKKMVDYANEHFQQRNVNFEVMNIEGDISAFRSKFSNGFDHITSFYTLHWMRSLKNALKNICDLLNPGGDCLLTFLARQPVVEIFDDLAKRPQWSKFMSSAYDHFSPIINRDDTVSHVLNALTQAGFSEFRYEILQRSCQFVGDDFIKANISVVNPAFPKMNAIEQNDYWTDFFDLCVRRKYYKKLGESNMGTLENPHELMVIYAIK